MTKLIPVGRDFFTLVDDEDFDRFSQFSWSRKGWMGKYVGRTVKVADGGRTTVYLHRLINDQNSKLEVDHISFDTFDNRRINLRNATRSQNEQNRKRIQPNSLTKVRGVETIRNRTGSISYGAVVWILRKKIRLGYYKTVQEAEAAARAGRSKLMTHAPECVREKGL